MAKSLIEIGFDEETKALVRELIDSRKQDAQTQVAGYDPYGRVVYCPVEQWTEWQDAVKVVAWLDRVGTVHWVNPLDSGAMSTARDAGWLRLFAEIIL